MEFQKEVTEYIREHSNLMRDQTRKYLMTLTFSIDFRSEYTMLHTEYAVHLSKNIAHVLHLPAYVSEQITAAALLHNAGKVALTETISKEEDYLGYLKSLYHDSTYDITRQILADNVDEQILNIIEESSHVLKCWKENQAITFSPTPAAETVALSYLMSNSLSLDMSVSYCHHPRLRALLKDKYQSSGIDDRILRTVEHSFDNIIEKTQKSCSAIFDTYQQMMEESRSLNIILQHYNNKY